MGYTWKWNKHGIDMEMRYTQDTHGHQTMMSTGSTWAWNEYEQRIYVEAKAHAKYSDLVKPKFNVGMQPGVQGRSPWQAGDPVPQERSERSEVSVSLYKKRSGF